MGDHYAWFEGVWSSRDGVKLSRSPYGTHGFIRS